MAPLHVRKELGPDTDYQATRKGLLNEVLKPKHPTKHHWTTFQRCSVKSNGFWSKCWSHFLGPWVLVFQLCCAEGHRASSVDNNFTVNERYWRKQRRRRLFEKQTISDAETLLLTYLSDRACLPVNEGDWCDWKEMRREAQTITVLQWNCDKHLRRC